MKTLLLLSLFCASAFAQVPVVTILGFDGSSHSTTGVTFSTNIQPSNIRLRYIASPQTCTSGTGGFVQTTTAAGSNITPSFIRLNATGLAPNTTYQFCPEATTDGTNWSSGVGATFTTLPLPSPHPALPIPPATFNSSYPDTTGYATVNYTTSCATFQTDLNNAIANLMTQGTVFSISPAVTCSTPISLPEFPDLIYFAASNVSTANSTIGLTAHGLSEGQQVVFSYNNYSGVLPGGIVDGYLYYVHVVDANDFQVFYGGPAGSGGTLVTLTSQGSGKPRFVKFPRPLKYIIIRTSTPDSQFVPEHVRLAGPNNSAPTQWTSLMPTFKVPISNVGVGTPNIFFQTSNDPNVEVMAANIRFVGILWTTDNNTEVSSNPIPWLGFLRTFQTDSNITIDRNYFHGQGFPNRYYRPFYTFDGMDMAIKESYWDNFDYWHGTLNGMAGALTGNQSFTIAPGSIYYGAAQPGVLNQTLTVTISGTPNGATQPVEGAVYFDMKGNLTVGTPSGVTASANIPITNTTVPNGNGACNYSDVVFPQDSKSRMAAGAVACFGVTPAGVLTNIEAGDPYSSGEATEGCQCFIAGVGPGPFEISNDYASTTGLGMHFDDSGGTRDRGDYLIRRNTYHSPFNHMLSGALSDGYAYAQRQPLEWKGGQRIKVDGNIFDGSWREVTPSSLFLDITMRTGGYSTDADVTNNTFQHGPGVTQTIEGYDNYPPVISKPGLRYRFQNNLAWDINGWSYTAFPTNVNAAGQGWDFEAGESMEDAIINHNTFFDSRGRDPIWFGWDGYPGEGVSVTNNFLFYVGDNRSAFNIANYYSPGCSGTDETYMDCTWTQGIGVTNYTFRNNVIIPSWNSSQSANGQVSQATIQAAFPKRYSSNSLLSSSLGGVAQTIASVKWFNPSIGANAPNFRLQPGSPFVSSGKSPASDGLDVGANIDALEAAQGKVVLTGVPNNSITSTSAIVSFVAPDAQGCPVDYSSTDPTLTQSFTRVADAGGVTTRNITLSGLSSKTVYYYRVDCAVQQPTGQFQTF